MLVQILDIRISDIYCSIAILLMLDMGPPNYANHFNKPHMSRYENSHLSLNSVWITFTQKVINHIKDSTKFEKNPKL